MSVLIETSLGSFVIDLYTTETPRTSFNFIKLCKIGYYNNVLFYNVQKDYIIQSGDPTGTGRGGRSIYNQMYGNEVVYFDDEIHPSLRHNTKGIVSMANTGLHTNTSQFFITVHDKCSAFDDHNTVFGYIAEGYGTIEKMNETYCDDDGRPYGDIRILRTVILIDPFPDSPLLLPLIQHYEQQLFTQGITDRPAEERVPKRLSIEETENIIATTTSTVSDGISGNMSTKKTEEEMQRMKEQLAEDEARSRAVVLEMVGDLPSADVTPPEDTLFICKLNPVTTAGDIELIFSRFGDCKVDILRDPVTNASLCYGFVEYTSREHCELAYNKMNGVLIDDRRIKVDFSQSVSRLWNQYKYQRKNLVRQGNSGGGLVPSFGDDAGKIGGYGSRPGKEGGGLNRGPHNNGTTMKPSYGHANGGNGTTSTNSSSSNAIDMTSILSAVKARVASLTQNNPVGGGLSVPYTTNTTVVPLTVHEKNNVPSIPLSSSTPILTTTTAITNDKHPSSSSDKDEQSRDNNQEDERSSKHKKHHHRHHSSSHRRSRSRSRSPPHRSSHHHHSSSSRHHHRSDSRSRSRSPQRSSRHRSEEDRQHRSSHHHHQKR